MRWIISSAWEKVAAEMCADPVTIRSCTLSTMAYRNPPLLTRLLFANPADRYLYEGTGDHYIQTIAP
jgi:hypothetical protein